jgi:CheY-like chemotaxis protein
MPTVLSVGQCYYDDSRIGKLVRETLGAFLDRAASSEEATRLLSEKKYDLILVNRAFDSGTGEGLDFITQTRQSGNTTPLMLVSDYLEAQAAAIANGALPGFGKSALASPDTTQKLRAAMNTTIPSP